MDRYSTTTLVVLCIAVSLLIALANGQTGGRESKGDIYLENGKYKGILVAVDQSVEFQEEVFSHLKEYIRRTSEALYIATSPVAARSFGEVTILLPRSWPTVSQCKSVSTENQNKANFIVEKDTTLWGSHPHTHKIDSQCGKPGKVTYLPRSFVVDLNEARKYGDNIGKTILHEWGHLRYGLFDELEEVSNPTTCLRYNGVAQPIKCSTEVQGTIEDDGDHCSFTPNLNQPEGVKASIMYLPYLDSVETFCNKTGAGITHNREAQNQQNDRCGGQSAWEVMMEHPDFKLHKESATAHGVSIQCVQERDLDRMVLVMDISGSMQEDHRLLRMQQDVRQFLHSLPCRDTSIGMVEFSGNMSEATITHPLATINSDSNMESLIAAIPESTLDRTCIGCGIKRAIQLVASSGRTVDGTVLVIFTDGLENEPPFIDEVTSDVISNGLVVYSVMLMSQSRDHPLIKLSSQTGGKSCTFTQNQDTSYYDCLNGILHHRSPLTAPSQVLSTLISAKVRESVSGNIIIDARPGEDLIFTVTWSTKYLGGCEDTFVTITSPTGAMVGKDSTDKYNYNYRLRTVTIELVADETTYKPGVWTYLIDNRDYHTDCVCRLRVEARRHIEDCSQPIPDTELPIVIAPTISDRVDLNRDNDPLDNAVKLYVEVTKDGNIVLNASVYAEIESDTGRKWNITLLDNGIGADLKANDGTYSRYFTDFDDDGTYSVKFNVIGDENTVIKVGSTTKQHFTASILPNYTSSEGDQYKEIDPFTRTTVGGIFEVKNYENATKNGTEVKEQIYPPEKITTLSLKFDRDTGIITLSWTAVGDILDQGKAASIDIRWATSADDLRSNFNSSQKVTLAHVVSGSISEAQSVGSEELLILSTEAMELVEQQIYFIAMKTINSYNLASPVSNVVVFQFLSPYMTSTPGKTTSKSVQNNTDSDHILGSNNSGGNTISETPDTTSPHLTDRDSTISQAIASAKDDDKGSMPTWVYFVIAGLGGALLITLLIVCMICTVKPSKKSKDTSGFIGPAGMTTTPDAVNLEIIEASGRESDQEPDLIKEICEKDQAANQKSGVKHSTWPVTKQGKKKREKKRRGNILRSLGKSHFVNEIRKRLSLNKSSERLDQPQWSSPSEPLQDHPYSNPLYGNAVMVPEIQIHNAVIQPPIALPSPNGDGTASLYERMSPASTAQKGVISEGPEATGNLYGSRLSLQ